MFRLNFKIALRNIRKNYTSSIINIAGLAIGMASFLLLMLYASYEWGFDKQFKNASNTYQVMINLKDGNGETIRTINLSQNVIAATIKEGFPDVKHIARTTSLYKRLLSYESKSFKIDSRYADPDFIRIFDYQFIYGNPAKALNDPNSIILTESAAKRLFGTMEVLNKILKFENQADVRVTAVIKDLPKNISFTFEALTPWSLFEKLNQWPAKPNWGNHDFFTLMTLNKGADVGQLNAKLKDVVKKHHALANEDVFIFPLTKLHLFGDFVNGKSIGGQIKQVKMYAGLALGILLIACINFINLSTAHSQKFAKEVSIKKTLGASKSSLIFQFLLTSWMLTGMSIIIALATVELCLPWFNNLLQIHLTIDYLDPFNWIYLFALLILTGGLAGGYPAFYLSGFNPVQAFRMKTYKSGFSLSLRQVLVVTQFSFAIVLIASTIIIYKQLHFVENRPLGYNSSALVELPHEGLLYNKYELLKARVLASNAVTSITQSSNSITNKGSSIRDLQWEGMSATDKLIDFDQIYTTYDFIKTMGIKLFEGRDFNKNFSSDAMGLLLSKKAVKVMNLKQPIGAQILYQGERRTVVGVFEDIVWENRSQFSAPMVVAYADGISDAITMRLNQEKNLSESIALISSIVKELNPDFPVDITFIDSLNTAKLKNETTLATIAHIFGGLSIFISCLGLYGLSSFNAQQRTKEIAIRKVLGASVSELMYMMSLNFIILVIISIVISVPIASYFMNDWLNNYDIRISISMWIFVLTGAFTILIALLTVFFQTFKVAYANPVKALKYE